MYDIASSVAACLRAGTRVDVAWAVETRGFSSREPAEALAMTADGGRIGALLSGSLDSQLAKLCEEGGSGRLVSLQVSEADAAVAGLSCGGTARCLLVPAVDLPPTLWARLREREPVSLVTRVEAERVLHTDLFTADTVEEAGEDAAALFRRGVSATAGTTDSIVTVLWPVPKLVLVGAGAVIDALAAAAGLLGWQVHTRTESDAATEVIAGLTAVDKVVVTSHDNELAGPALAAALSSGVGYIGALGSRRTQQSRAGWLAGRGVTDLGRVHGPAGLDIGSSTPAEIAVSILAEALAVGKGAAAGSLRERAGSIH
jgi:xanthine dehydrogenase accessory factor